MTPGTPDAESLSLDPVALTDGEDIRRMLEEMGPGENGFQTGADDLSEGGLAPWLLARVRMAEGQDLLPNQVPMVTYWLRRDGRPLGMSKLRVRLTDGLRKLGGHIGFGLRPTERGKGYAPLLLLMTLEKARAMDIDRALLTCDVNNERSWRTIERCGGTLEKIENRHRYYWIETAGARNR